MHIRAILGLPVNTRLNETAASAVILGGVDGKLVEYQGLEHALAIPDSEVRLFAKPEAFVSRRMGVALSTAATVPEARSKAVKAASLIHISVA